MKHVYLLKYNNYANRIMKVENSYTDYLGSGNANLIALIDDMVNWNPNDGVTTSIKTKNNTSFSDGEPDYCICVDEYGRIDSRWFVIENIRIHKDQYQCQLKRDVFAEAWADLMNATCNIDRALLSKYDPRVFNAEPITVNQIITEETLIRDKTGVPWIVFYGSDTPSPVSFDPSMNTYNLTVPDRAAWVTENQFRFFPNDAASVQLSLSWEYYDIPGDGHLDLIPGGIAGSTQVAYRYIINPTNYTPAITNPSAVPVANLYSAILAYENAIQTEEYKRKIDYDELMAYDGSTLYDSGDNSYWQIEITTTTVHADETLTAPAAAALVSDCQSIITNNTNIPANQGSYTTPAAQYFTVHYDYKQISIALTPAYPTSAIAAKVPNAGTKPFDSPYNMWCMPYGAISMTYGADTVMADKDINLAAAMAFSKANTGNKIYDFQILPFCPLPDEYINADGSITVDSTAITDSNTMKDGNNDVVGFIFACPYSTFTRQVLFDSPYTVTDPKTESIEDVYRLYSPNYASSFEFSVAKNGGLAGFNIRCTYMPISPYIRVAPIWGGIYGSSSFDKDPRGLIFTGDYSLPRITDAWVNYQEQNKNFESIFNREIENMDVMRKYQLIEQIASAGAGIAAGAAAGAAAGSFIPGLGTAVGAVIGGLTAGGTGAADLFIGQGKFQESRSYATDMHTLQLENVRAMPRTLSKTTAFNVDNRYFPVFVRYTCTLEEHTAIQQFIQNRSMNVGVIDKPQNYVGTTWNPYGYPARGFIQGSIIKIETTFDTHFVDELNKEFQMGVYMR